MGEEIAKKMDSYIIQNVEEDFMLLGVVYVGQMFPIVWLSDIILALIFLAQKRLLLVTLSQ